MLLIHSRSSPASSHVQSRPARPAQPSRPASSHPAARPAPRRAHFVSEESPLYAQSGEADHLFSVRSPSRVSPITVEVSLNGNPVQMEVDTGASCSMMNSSMFRDLMPEQRLPPQSRRLFTYTSEEVRVCGVAHVRVVHGSQ